MSLSRTKDNKILHCHCSNNINAFTQDDIYEMNDPPSGRRRGINKAQKSISIEIALDIVM